MGELDLNPFCWEPHGVASIQFSVNGTLVPAKRFEPNWTSEKNYIRCYREFCELIGLNSQGNTVKFTPKDYVSRYCFYGISLSCCHGCNNSHNHVKMEQMGNVTCEIIFETPPAEPLQLMTYTTHRKVISIDALRNLKFDY